MSVLEESAHYLQCVLINNCSGSLPLSLTSALPCRNTPTFQYLSIVLNMIIEVSLKDRGLFSFNISQGLAGFLHISAHTSLF